MLNSTPSKSWPNLTQNKESNFTFTLKKKKVIIVEKILAGKYKILKN